MQAGLSEWLELRLRREPVGSNTTPCSTIYEGSGLRWFVCATLEVFAMYAVIRTGGKQYRVAPGDKLKIETTAHENGAVLAQGDREGIRSVIANGPAWVKEKRVSDETRPSVETLRPGVRFSHERAGPCSPGTTEAWTPAV